MPVARRALILAGLLLLSAAGARLGDGSAAQPSRWPVADQVFAARGWATGTPTVESNEGVVFVSRRYSSLDGNASAVLSIKVSSEAKRVYRAGADVPFAGSGYRIDPVPADLFPERREWSTALATLDGRSVLIIAATGERRGILGTGAVAWAEAVADRIMGRPNVYFQAILVVPLKTRDDTTTAASAADLADRLFEQVVLWNAD